MRVFFFSIALLAAVFVFAGDVSAQACRPNDNQIAVFEHSNYRGRCRVKTIGTYSSSGSIGLPNDSITSIIVGRNVYADLCRDNGFRGTCQRFTGSDPNLGNNRIGNDQVSSIRVGRRAGVAVPARCNPGPNQIAVYSGMNYTGRCVVKNIGSYRNPAAIGLINDTMSSVRVGSNVYVDLCRDDGFRGTCQRFTGSDSNLGNNRIGDNQVSSLRVVRKGTVSSTSCVPGPNQIAVYSGMNYTGRCVVRNIGDYRNPAAIGLINDTMSSVRVGSNVYVDLCRDDGFRGTCQRFTGSDSNLGNNRIGDNQVSSLRVVRKGTVSTARCVPGPNQIAVFSGKNYTGQCVVRNLGDYRNPAATGLRNDTMSSVKVGSNASAVLCRNTALGNPCYRYSRNYPDLSQLQIGDNQVSSMRAVRRSSNTSGGNSSVRHSPPNSSYKYCATQGNQCRFSGTRTVAYGSDGKFKYRRNVRGAIACNDRTFGDPNPGRPKRCYFYGTTTSTGRSVNVIKGYGDNCLTVSGGGTANGTPVVMSDCNGSARQIWTRTRAGELRALGKCLDNDNSRLNNGNKIQIWTCNGGGNQKWSFNNNLLRVAAGKCLDVYESRTNNGARVAIWDCHGRANQRFTYTTYQVGNNNNSTGTTSGGPNSSYRYCANEGNRCTYTGNVRIAYGANGKFSYRTVTSPRSRTTNRFIPTSIACTNTTFGDPNPGQVKRCYVQRLN